MKFKPNMTRIQLSLTGSGLDPCWMC